MNWLLPEYVADALPQETARMERLRRAMLDLFRTHGYEQVMPPLLEYIDSLLTGPGSLLRLRTFKLVDQLSGRTMGIRADTTPQTARIDAHLLNRQGVTRLCYCGSVLHALPESQMSSRELVQLGAELYGYAGLEADIEIVRLLAAVFETIGVRISCIDISHVGIFRALAREAGIDAEAEKELLRCLHDKDTPGIRSCCAAVREPCRSALMRLPELYGGAALLDSAERELPRIPEIASALSSLRRLRSTLSDLPLSFDLADLTGYHYHNGIVFSAYPESVASAIARGGRYDGAGKIFGRPRPATGFSMDLRAIARIAPCAERANAILAPWPADDSVLSKEIDRLRKQGETVVELLPGQMVSEGPLCDRRLVEDNGQWLVKALNGD
ncbi:MAG: ATP phosphoribosyltransferase regulatory subunit [Candidatus Accumulibacter sp.]|jgi:ATP phosphoribosyltransferase regulatory subunit|nr:ATP phosphoribosyltransferase regulatory subunit [Accumulibacter sp.]